MSTIIMRAAQVKNLAGIVLGAFFVKTVTSVSVDSKTTYKF
jgi:hypothetical protein